MATLSNWREVAKLHAERAQAKRLQEQVTKAERQANTSTPAEPSAFPTLERGYHGLELTDPGMNLRDWFAGQVLGVLTEYFLVNDEFRTDDWTEPTARYAYELADAMMKERNK